MDQSGAGNYWRLVDTVCLHQVIAYQLEDPTWLSGVALFIWLLSAVGQRRLHVLAG